MTDDVALEAHEHREHAEHAAHSGDLYLRRVSITIAILAVASATISSLEANESAAAIAASSDAVLHQDRATDAWGFFQAKTIKEGLFAIAADRGGPKAGGYRKEAERHHGDQAPIQAKALNEEKLAAQATAEQLRHERRHHALSLSETLSHVAIAIATIAIITGQRWPWVSSIGLGVMAGVAAAIAYA
jgi:hypothetical protein